jgi:hypothetical protein
LELTVTESRNPWASLPLLAVLLMSLGRVAAGADDPVFSGPQPGEKLPKLEVVGVYDDAAGQPLDFVAQAKDGPLLLIFMHQVTRPSAGLTRALSHYADGRAADGLTCGIVWLTADRTQAEEYLKRARPSLDLKSPVGLSPDGIEGPGAYGLNRNVGLTVLVADKGQVTANFALIQPALTDAPAILEEVVKLIGGEVPTLEQLQGSSRRGRQP